MLNTESKEALKQRGVKYEALLEDMSKSTTSKNRNPQAKPFAVSTTTVTVGMVNVAIFVLEEHIKVRELLGLSDKDDILKVVSTLISDRNQGDTTTT